jgi:hypothetical protein
LLPDYSRVGQFSVKCSMKVSIKSSAFRAPATSLLLALSGLVALGAGSVQAQQPRSISDCRAIEGELARYACYESLEATAAGSGAPAAAAPQAPAATSITPARPVANLPVVRRPSLSEGDLTGAPAAAGTAPATAVVRQSEDEEKPGLLRRLLPFGGDDDEQEEPEAQVAEAAPAAPAAAGNAVDSFGRTGGARVETNEEGMQELVDTIASLRTINQSLVEVTLESGQVWRQMLSKRYPIVVGDTITIRPTRWGSSYRLTSERISGYIQVERVD